MLRRPCVCLVTDRRQLSAARTTGAELIALERHLERAIDAGIDLIQIRERDLDAASLAALASRVTALASRQRTNVVVNDRADIAIAARAHGVHLRGDGPDIERVRSLGPGEWTVGRSVHTLEGVRAHQSADYLLFGTMFESASKPVGAEVQSIDRLAAAAAVSTTPVLAIGGITLERAAACATAGASGVAAIGLFAGISDVATLRALVDDLRAVFQGGSNLLE